VFKRLDQSSGLARLIEALGNFLARQRGLPVVVGIVLVVISFVVQLLNVFVGSGVLELIGVVVLHLGIISALVGLLLAEALGS
jgi:hypothetical protein